ncbi:MAG: hypothetical protein ACP5R4_08490 [Armatimonadota bacterium]
MKHKVDGIKLIWVVSSEMRSDAKRKKPPNSWFMHVNKKFWRSISPYWQIVLPVQSVVVGFGKTICKSFCRVQLVFVGFGKTICLPKLLAGSFVSSISWWQNLLKEDGIVSTQPGG